ncbi:hypothetical protein ACFWVC_27215 [Streptomyces sp. NPDC058691]
MSESTPEAAGTAEEEAEVVVSPETDEQPAAKGEDTPIKPDNWHSD